MADSQAINPLLPLPPSSDGPSRIPPPRNTYGRARAGTPPADIPSFIAGPSTLLPHPSRESPSKLLNRWSSNRQEFFNSLSDLQPITASGAGSDVELLEFVRKQKLAAAAARRLPEVATSSLVAEDLRPPSDLAPRQRAWCASSPLTALSDAEPTSEPTELPSSALPSSSPPRPRSATPQPIVAVVASRSSPPPSSPPPPLLDPVTNVITISSDQPSSAQDEDETFPIRRMGIAKTATRRRVAASSDEEDNVRGMTPAPPSSASPRREPPLAHTSRSSSTAKSRSPTPHSDSDPESDPDATKTAPSAARRRSVSEPIPESDEDEAEEPGMSKANVFLQELFAADGADNAAASEEMQRSVSANSAETIRDGSDEDEEGIVSAGRGKPLKSLNKKDQELIKRDAERARREQQPTFERPPPKKQPVSSYSNFVVNAAQCLGNRKEERATAKPLLRKPAIFQPERVKRTQPIEPIQASQHEEIEMFPSSRDKSKGHDVSIIDEPQHRTSPPPPSRAASSPMPTRPSGTVFKPANYLDSDDEAEEEEELSLAAWAASAVKEKEAKEEAERTRIEREEAESLEAERKAAEEASLKAELARKRSDFQAMKAAAAAAVARKPPVKAPVDDDDSDEFDLVRESPLKAKVDIKPVIIKRKGPDARAVLNRDPNLVPENTRNRQRVLAFAGKSGKGREEDATETYVMYAAKTFQHSEQRAANGGSRPAGQKAGRDRQLAQAELETMLAVGHAAQAAAVRQKKEQNYGRIKALPNRQEADYNELAERVAQRAAQIHVEVEEEGSDEDPEDENFAPSGEESEVEAGSGSEGGDQAEVEGGDDDEGMDIDSAPQAVSSTDDEDADDEENIPLVKSRKSRHRSNRVAFASDDEEVTPKSITKVPVATQTKDSRVPLAELGLGAFENDLNFDGFGDDDDLGGGGFSQLFEQTQANTPPAGVDAAKDVFAGMRPDPMALLNAHAILPKNNISETQAQRDDALVAAEIEEAMEGIPRIRTQPRPQYLNDAGFFTQTKPSSQYPTQARLTLAGSSTDNLSFQQNTQYIPNSDDHDGSSDLVNRSDKSERINRSDRTSPGNISPTQGSAPRLNRLRRRGSDGLLPASLTLEPTQLSPTAPPAPPARTAFTELMANRRRSPGPKTAPTKSKLVEEQAEESDEDNGWGPAGGDGREGEDDEGEDDDAFLPDLVDDQVIDAEEKRKQDELADEKRREIEKLDDAKREAQARKVTEGKHREKRKGGNLYSDQESDEEGSPRKRRNKAERQERRMEKADGITILPGERNAFKEQYEDRNDSDPEDDMEEEGEIPVPIHQSPGSRLSRQEEKQMLRKAGAMHKEADAKSRLDKEVGLGRNGTFILDDEDEDIHGDESQFSIARPERTISIVTNDDDHFSYRPTVRNGDAARSSAYISEQSQANRRPVGVSSSSVVTKKIPDPKRTKGDQKYGARRTGSSGGFGGSGSVSGKLLASKTKSFAF